MHVVVLGANYITLTGVIRSLGLEGHEVTVARVGEPPSALIYNPLMMERSIEKYSQYTARHVWIEPDAQRVMRFLLQECARPGEKAVLFPTDDFTASVIDHYQEQLREHFLYPHIRHTPGKVDRLMDKWLQKQLARSSGMPVADGWSVEKTDGLYPLPEGVRYPCIVKPQVSYAGAKDFIQKCASRQELEAALREIAARSDCALLIEEFVVIEKEYAVVGFCDENTVFVPFLFEMLEGGSGLHKGVTMKGRVTPLDQDGELARQLEGCLHAAGFTGLFDVDLYERDGIIYFNELNVRFGASGYAATAMGVNLPELFLLSITGDERLGERLEQGRTLLRRIDRERIFVSEKVALEEFTGGYISQEKYRRLLDEADIYFLKPTPGLTDGDTGPYRKFCRNDRFSTCKKYAKRLLGRA